MHTSEEALFDIHCKKFNEAVDDYRPYDDRAWSFLDLRQQEIMNSLVDNERKAKAFDGVLAAIYRIFPQDDKYYCKALEKQLSYTDKTKPDDIKRIAQDAYMHRRNADLADYGKVIYEAYRKFSPKKDFPYTDIAKHYERKHPILEERKKLEKEISDIAVYLEEGNLSPEKKLSLIEDVVEMFKEPYFKKSEVNDEKAIFYHSAVNICREELFDTDLADQYLQKAIKCKENAQNAREHWRKDRNLTDKQVQEIIKNKTQNKR